MLNIYQGHCIFLIFRCHGEKGNIVHELGSKFQVFDSATTKYDKFLLVKSDGKTVPMKESDKLMELAISIVECHKEELSMFRGSLGSFIVDKYDYFKNAIKYF